MPEYTITKESKTIVVTLANPNILTLSLNKMLDDVCEMYKTQNESFCVILNMSILNMSSLDATTLEKIVVCATDMWPVTEKYLMCLCVVVPVTNQTFLSVVSLPVQNDARFNVCCKWNEAVALCHKSFKAISR